MPNFLVRRRETERSVGIFAVSGLAELMDMVKRVSDLAACEYAAVGADPFREDTVFAPFPADGVASVANDP